MNTFGHTLILKTKIENEIFRNHTCPLRIYAFSSQTIGGVRWKTVIQRVYEQVAGILDDAYVATDDERIEAAVKAFGGKVVMTSTEHKSGTDRCQEACTKIGGQFDVVVNIQGDEPFIQPSQLQAVKACFDDPATQIATLVKPFTVDNGFEALENVNSPKVVLNKTGMPSILAVPSFPTSVMRRRKTG